MNDYLKYDGEAAIVQANLLPEYYWTLSRYSQPDRTLVLEGGKDSVGELAFLLCRDVRYIRASQPLGHITFYGGEKARVALANSLPCNLAIEDALVIALEHGTRWDGIVCKSITLFVKIGSTSHE